MELVEGRPLEDATPETLEARLALGRGILEALAAVHRNGFVHGDLSPRNILATPEGDVKLIDVGCGAVFGGEETDIRISTTAEESEEVLGVASPLYAAPERFTSRFLEGCGRPALPIARSSCGASTSI